MMSRIDEILQAYNWPLKESIIDLDFSEIEDRIGFELANDYKEFLRKYSSHETAIGKEYCKLWSFDKLIELNHV